MRVCIQFGGIRIQINSNRSIALGDSLRDFLLPEDTPPDVVFELAWDFENVKLPTSEPIGRDLILIHYRENGLCYALGDGGKMGVVSACVYTPDFSYVRCILNESAFIEQPKSIENVLRFYPLMALLQHFGVLFLHSSQIEYKGKGIIFTAPSGTGKTTQAKLWKRERGANMVCNDRTMLRRTDEGWKSYGCAIDGSDPIRWGGSTEPCAIVLLSQAPENTVTRMPLLKAVARLMPQMIINMWETEARVRAANALLELLADVPIYQYACTKEPSAVDCLEKMLIRDGVLNDE